MSKTPRGFSLAEALVAEFLMILALIFVISVFPILHKALLLAENRTRAASLAQSLLNLARTADFDSLAASSGNWTNSGVSDGKPFALRYDYQVQLRAQNPDLVWLWVTVRWTDGSGARQLTLQTQRTRR